MKLANARKHPSLHLPLPEGVPWQLVIVGPNLHEAIVDDKVLIRVRALVAPTAEHSMWVEGIMLEETPPGATLKQITLESTLSAIGLPVVFAHYQILREGGELYEERAGAFYAVLHNRAEVVVHLRGGATWASRSAELKPFILSGGITWPDYEDDLIVTQLGIKL